MRIPSSAILPGLLSGRAGVLQGRQFRILGKAGASLLHIASNCGWMSQLVATREGDQKRRGGNLMTLSAVTSKRQDG